MKPVGHIGLDDNISEDTIVRMYSEQGMEDHLFRGQFLKIEVNKNSYFGQIIDEPKNFALSGKSDSAINEYPILHQEKVKYVPSYKVVSKIKLLGEITEDNRLKSHFSRPKPASPVYFALPDMVRSILRLDGDQILGLLMGYESQNNPITITVSDSMGRKQLGIFGMTGSGKSNTCLRIAEIFSKMGWCVIFLDYLGEYSRCQYPSEEKKLFTSSWENIGIQPEGNENVKVYLPTSDPRKSLSARKFTLMTKYMNAAILNQMFCKTEAQRRLFGRFLRNFEEEGKTFHLHTISEELEDKTDERTRERYTWGIIKARIDNELEKKNRLFDYHPVDSKQDNTLRSKISDLDPLELLENGRINVLDFKNVSESDYAATTFLLLKRLYTLKKEHGGSINQYPKVMIMIEEAHIPFAESDTNIYSGPLNNIARKVFKIGRHYYLNICAISQRPADIPDSILSQINTRFIHRLKTSKDIYKVITGDIKEYSTAVSSLGVGEALVDSADFITPLTTMISPACSKKIDPFVNDM